MEVEEGELHIKAGASCGSREQTRIAARGGRHLADSPTKESKPQLDIATLAQESKEHLEPERQGPGGAHLRLTSGRPPGASLGGEARCGLEVEAEEMPLPENLFGPNFIHRFYPYKNCFSVAAFTFLLIALLIMTENIVFLTSNEQRFVFPHSPRRRHPVLIIIPYLLSWALLLFSVLFCRLSVLLHSAASKRLVSNVRPVSASSAWTESERGDSPTSHERSDIPEIHLVPAAASHLGMYASSPYARYSVSLGYASPTLSSPFLVSDMAFPFAPPPPYSATVETLPPAYNPR